MAKISYPPKSSRKDEETMLEQITMTVVGVGAFLAVAAACVGGYLVYQRKKRQDYEEAVQKGKAQRARIEEEKRREEERKAREQRKKEQEHLKLTNEYCQKNLEIDGYRDWDAYRRCFNEIAPFLQLLLGAERRYAQEGAISETNLRTALQLSVQNAGLDRKLTAGGFQVTQVPSEYDEEALRRSCEKVDNNTIQEENNKLERRLRDYRRSLDYKQIIQGSESILYTILQDIQRGDIQSFLKHDERHDERIGQLEDVLKDHKCYAIYWDDDRVKKSEAMRATFQEDSPYATELPGFFTETDDGWYDRIGILGGTMREV